MKQLTHFLLPGILILAAACAQAPETRAISPTPKTPAQFTPTVSPSPAPTLSPQPTKTLMPAITPSPAVSIEQLDIFWEIMVFVQWHSGLVSEAAKRAQSGEMDPADAQSIVQKNDFSTEQLDSTLEMMKKQNMTVPEEFSREWDALLEAHSTTTAIFSRWVDEEINAKQVLDEMLPVQAEVEETLVSAERALGKLLGRNGEELTQIRLRNIPPRILQVFEPQASEPTKVAEACAGEELNQAEVSRSGRIAFVSTRDGNAEIYTMNADGTGVTRLTDNPAGDYNPAWSPDGKRIAFYSQRDGNAEIYVVNADGSELTRLTQNPKDDFDPTWSPDGKQIAFHSHRLGENPLIFVMKADGAGVGNLSPLGVVDWSPDWSPVENKIVFNSGRNSDNREIWVMNADGSGAVNLSNHHADDWWPVWSPDGKQVAFHSDRSGNFDIFILDVLTKRTTQLTDDPALEYGAAWSADGTRIAYTSDRSGNREICIQNADGTGVYNLTNHPAHDWAAAWMPESP